MTTSKDTALPCPYKTDAPAIITEDGQPVMIAMSCEQFQSLVETMEILSDKEFMVELREGIRQAEAGETISLEEFKIE
ncbi:MAG TPA: hypothetical protein IGS52_17000 [Oscillatoriaceae cyanobacterium M33_DOE_052]|nr:hypothetical protein [Oscillatoriaceae cyanobacterium M33_DOE_052]